MENLRLETSNRVSPHFNYWIRYPSLAINPHNP
jgi:hypothetical protein